jgi:carboxymethylenebutenolidase
MKRRHILFASSGIAIASLFTKTDKTIAKPNPGQMVKLASDLQGYYVAPGTTGPYPAVIVQMEAFGLNDNIKQVCDRLAQQGYAALAPDFYRGETFAYTNVDGAVAKLKSLKDDTAMADFGNSLAFLAQRPEVKPAIGTIGFCMGGRLVYLACAAHADKLKAGVAYYGGGIAANPDPLGRPALLDRTAEIKAPIMLLYGANDQMIAADEHGRVAMALSNNRKRYVISVFLGAGHGFFSDRRQNYNQPAADESWEMTLSFFKRHLV